MKSIQMKSHVDNDGVLRVEAPVGFANQDVDVVIVIHPKNQQDATLGESGFVDKTAGQWKGAPLVRDPQGRFEEREAFE